MALALKKAVNVEYKHYQAALTAQTIDYNGYVNELCIPAQGDSDVSRDGDGIKVQSLKMRGQLAYGTNPASVRMWIVWDNQNKITTANDFLETTGSSIAVFSHKDWDARFQSRVLYDSGVKFLDPATNPTHEFSLKIPIGLHTQFEAGSTTINTGRLLVIAISSNVTTNLPTLSYIANAVFTDN